MFPFALNYSAPTVTEQAITLSDDDAAAALFDDFVRSGAEGNAGELPAALEVWRGDGVSRNGGNRIEHGLSGEKTRRCRPGSAETRTSVVVAYRLEPTKSQSNPLL